MLNSTKKTLSCAVVITRQKIPSFLIELTCITRRRTLALSHNSCHQIRASVFVVHTKSCWSNYVCNEAHFPHLIGRPQGLDTVQQASDSAPTQVGSKNRFCVLWGRLAWEDKVGEIVCWPHCLLLAEEIPLSMLVRAPEKEGKWSRSGGEVSSYFSHTVI